MLDVTGHRPGPNIPLRIAARAHSSITDVPQPAWLVEESENERRIAWHKLAQDEPSRLVPDGSLHFRRSTIGLVAHPIDENPVRFLQGVKPPNKYGESTTDHRSDPSGETPITDQPKRPGTERVRNWGAMLTLWVLPFGLIGLIILLAATALLWQGSAAVPAHTHQGSGPHAHAHGSHPDFFTNGGNYMERTSCLMTASGEPDWPWIITLVVLNAGIILA